MAVDTERRTTIAEPVGTTHGRKKAGVPTWAWIATTLSIVVVAASAFAMWQGRPEPATETMVSVYLDPMTSAREGGPYAEPPAPTSFPDAMTSVREGGAYVSTAPATDSRSATDPMTALREGGTYAQSGPDR